ncbi:hypothetical protein FM042_09555 [Aliidiomarina halalkaliphila]|uniref:Protoporphyrinogen IX oxidase n=1 Tax=Aliidiomarina halalkaliphila TaxID=2593535 RepID=A0A552X023_9GAMM|nr:CopD family protein [Aliidiomarina halalkaliphila]TRW48411.1 hypothetical protein FM042_09555 [Aliidiomarina halalkaliphila]
MLWVLSLHIIFLTIWVAGAYYVPVVLAGAGRHENKFTDPPAGIDSMARFVYTHIATPAALISITAGSVVFWLNQSAEFWLIAKLTLVTMMAACQASMGLLIIRVERKEYAKVRVLSYSLIVLLSLLIAAILWIVLAKPAIPESLPWTL